MDGIRNTALWAQLRSPRILLLLATVAVCLIRARNQPALNVGLGSTTVSVVPGDVLLTLLAVVALIEVVRHGIDRSAWAGIAAAAAFGLLIVVSGAMNGSAAFVSGVKLVELAAIGLGVIAFVRGRTDFEAIVDVLLLFTLAADAIGLVKFVTAGGGRQPSFLGEHDFAALSTLPLLYGLATLSSEHRRRAWLAIVSGAIGCILGAALASLLGLYLGAAVLIAVAVLHRRLRLRQLASIVLVVLAVTGGTLELRSGDLGFLQSWFGKPPSRPGQYASSWSQRLIYTYIGGRIFVAHPFLGTGWYGNLPPREFVAYLPAAHRRFSDQPANYFPPANEPYIPQQTFDQVLYELGVVGGVLMLALLIAAARGTALIARRTLAGIGAVPATWLAAALGALAGEALFGGTPLVAMFWLVVGVCLAFAIPGRRLT